MKSYLWQDLYCQTMKQVVWDRFANAEVEFKFICRNKNIDFAPHMSKIEDRLDKMNGLGPVQKELDHMRTMPFMRNAFIDELSHFKINTNYLSTSIDNDGNLDIRAKGPWYQTIDFEVPVLGAVNEAYFSEYDTEETRAEGDRRLTEKIEQFWEIHKEYEWLVEHGVTCHPYRLMEFGTRRAFSEDWQEHVVRRLANEMPPDMLVGCSNVYLAMLLGLKAQGTMAHQFLMAMQAFYAFHLSQKKGFENWNDFYRGDLGIALSDTLGLKQFLKDFDKSFAMCFTGPRHDSGDPFVWGHAIIDHYRELGIDSFTKTGAWTNGLDIKESADIWREFRRDIRTSFGMGTFLTNDLGPKPLNIVMKMVKCNGVPLVKLSDDIAKSTCENEHLKEWALDLCVR